MSGAGGEAAGKPPAGREPTAGSERKRLVGRRVRRRLPEIEEWLADGYTHEAVVERLNAEGVEVSFLNFRQILYRSRRKAGQQAGGNQGPPASPARATETPTVAPQAVIHEAPSDALLRNGGTAEGRPEAAPASTGRRMPRSLEEALDPKLRDQFVDQFMVEAPPRLGRLLKDGK